MIQKLTIEITEGSSIKVTNEHKDGKEINYITFSQLYQSLVDASANNTDSNKFNTFDVSTDYTIYPNNLNVSTIAYTCNENKTRELYILHKKSAVMDIQFYDNHFKNIYIPSIVFAIKIFNNRPKLGYVVALDSKTFFVDKNTKIYHFPYSNVYSDSKICFGGNEISKYSVDSPKDISKFPAMFLTMPFTEHNCMHNNNLGLSMRKFLEKVEKDGFNEKEILKPFESCQTLGEWIDLIIKK